MMKVMIVDFGMGNLKSVAKHLIRDKVNLIISNNPADLSSSNKIILPGVGHFSKAIDNLKSLSLWDPLNEAVLLKMKPILGICLGMQLMAKYSEEGEVSGFGWFDAEVIRFRVNDTLKFKVPHIGWNNVTLQKKSLMFEDIAFDSEFYFVHSYHIKANNPAEVLTTTNYEYDFVSGIEKENIFGIQFHPEKSHDVGEKLLSNFLKL